MVDLFKRVAAAALWAAAVGAQAAPVASGAGSCSKGVGGLLDDIASFTVSCPGGTWSDSRPGTLSTASWNASASAGILHASASVAIDTTPTLGSTTPLALGVSVRGTAGFSDDLLFDVPGLAGTAAKMKFDMWIDGTLFATKDSPNAAAIGRWQFIANNVSDRRFLGSAGESGKLENIFALPITGAPTVNRLYHFEIPVVLGQVNNLSLAIVAGGDASGWRGGSFGSAEFLTPVHSAAGANFANTALWQGITSLTLNDGTLLQGWSVTSASGLDYAQPVPEPTAWALFGAGLGLIGLTARRRRSG